MFWKNVSPKIHTLDSNHSKSWDKTVKNLEEHLAHEDRGTRIKIDVHTKSYLASSNFLGHLCKP